jgi:hypothetical protein
MTFRIVQIGDHTAEVSWRTDGRRAAELFAIRQASWSVGEFIALAHRYMDAAHSFRIAVDNEDFSRLAPLRESFETIRDQTSRMIETVDKIIAKANQECRK